MKLVVPTKLQDLPLLIVVTRNTPTKNLQYRALQAIVGTLTQRDGKSESSKQMNNINHLCLNDIILAAVWRVNGGWVSTEDEKYS